MGTYSKKNPFHLPFTTEDGAVITEEGEEVYVLNMHHSIILKYEWGKGLERGDFERSRSKAYKWFKSEHNANMAKGTSIGQRIMDKKLIYEKVDDKKMLLLC